MSIIRNDAGEVRLGWRLVLIILLFVAAEVLLRLIPIVLYAVFLVRDGMVRADAIETARTFVFEDPVCATVIGVLIGLIGFLIVWYMVRVIEKSSFTWEAVGLKWRKNSPGAILLGVILASGLFIAIVLTRHLIGISGDPLNDSTRGVSIPHLLQQLVLYLAMAFAERIVFMGYVQARLVERYGAVWGILITAVVFVLLHQISYSLSPVLILSGVMLWISIGVLYYLSKSLYLVVIMHGLLNTLMNTWDLEFGDTSIMIVYALALALVLVVALVRSRGSGMRPNPI
jgi:membrane protease YdiL (CAAX protease family)